MGNYGSDLKKLANNAASVAMLIALAIICSISAILLLYLFYMTFYVIIMLLLGHKVEFKKISIKYFHTFFKTKHIFWSLLLWYPGLAIWIILFATQPWSWIIILSWIFFLASLEGLVKIISSSKVNLRSKGEKNE